MGVVTTVKRWALVYNKTECKLSPKVDMKAPAIQGVRVGSMLLPAAVWQIDYRPREVRVSVRKRFPLMQPRDGAWIKAATRRTA